MATQVLTSEMRTNFVAVFVEGDGNCFWRAMAYGLWGSQRYWIQLKLVVLAYAAANSKELVGVDNYLYDNRKHYDLDVIAKYSYVLDGTPIPAFDDLQMMLLANLGRLCGSKMWGGYLTAHLACEALRVTVKVIHPGDMRARKQRDAGDVLRGTGRKGDTFDDHRWSHTFVPREQSAGCCVLGGAGKPDVFRDEGVITMATLGRVTKKSKLLAESIPEVDEHTDVFALNHFASIVTTDGSSRPFPMHLCAPPMFEIKVGDPRARCSAIGQVLPWLCRWFCECCCATMSRLCIV